MVTRNFFIRYRKYNLLLKLDPHPSTCLLCAIEPPSFWLQHAILTSGLYLESGGILQGVEAVTRKYLVISNLHCVLSWNLTRAECTAIEILSNDVVPSALSL